MSRIASEILVSAIMRTAQMLGGSSTVERRGSSISGAIFVTIYDQVDRTYSIYEPLQQALVPDDSRLSDVRFFGLKAKNVDRLTLIEVFEKEQRFDPDFWVVELEGVSVDQLADVMPTL